MNPKPRPRGSVVIVRDGSVALIKRLNDRGLYYVFPGGGVEDGESPADAAVREAREELGRAHHRTACRRDVQGKGPIFLCGQSRGRRLRHGNGTGVFVPLSPGEGFIHAHVGAAGSTERAQSTPPSSGGLHRVGGEGASCHPAEDR